MRGWARVPKTWVRLGKLRVAAVGGLVLCEVREGLCGIFFEGTVFGELLRRIAGSVSERVENRTQETKECVCHVRRTCSGVIRENDHVESTRGKCQWAVNRLEAENAEDKGIKTKQGDEYKT